MSLSAQAVQGVDKKTYRLSPTLLVGVTLVGAVAAGNWNGVFDNPLMALPLGVLTLAGSGYLIYQLLSSAVVERTKRIISIFIVFFMFFTALRTLLTLLIALRQ